MVPARREREVVVRKNEDDAPLRILVEVVRVVNSVLGNNEVVAARRF
jgi:hypothetical protein